MLSGRFKYKVNSELTVNYSLEGYDFSENIAFYIIPDDAASKRFLDGGISTPEADIYPSWEKYYISIGVSAVSAECEIASFEGVKYKSDINRDLISRLSQIIRGMKAGCTTRNLDRSGGDFSYSVNPNRVLRYNYQNGFIDLDMKSIRLLKYVSNDVDLLIEEDGSYSLKLQKPKDTLQRIKLDLSEFVYSVQEDWSESADKLLSLQEIIERNPHKDYAWLHGRKYYVVKTIEEVERVCNMIWNHKGIVAFDTETTGLNISVKSRVGEGDRLVGMVFSIKPGEAFYFPVAHKHIDNICTPADESFIIEKYFKPILEKKDIICHNGSFDWKVMHIYEICINLKEDTYILFKVTAWNDNRGMELNLKALTRNILHRDSFELSDFVHGKFGSNSITFSDFDEESAKYYACPDTDNLIELRQEAENAKLLDLYGARKIYQIEVAFSIVIAYQEFYGHCVDVSKLEDLVSELDKTMEKSYKDMVSMVGVDFNPNSSKDINRMMYEILGIPVIARTATGAPSTNKKVKEQLASEENPDGSPKYPFVLALQEYSDASKLKSNFTASADKFASADGLMFSQVEQFLETGRVSTKDPNYQSYSKVVKKYIVPRTGYYALDADYSSVEARIMCGMAGCKDVVERMKDPDMDYHTLKASQMYGIPYSAVTHEQRQISKGVNFGLLYGMGKRSLALRLYKSDSPSSQWKAENQMKLYFTGMEELDGFIKRSRAQGVRDNFSTTYFGRRRYYDPRKTQRDRIERQSCNARIQGTAADLYKVGMIRMFNQILKRGWVGRVLISAFVHDECYLEVHKSIDPFIILGVLRESMMVQLEGWSPLFISCGYGENWYEAKSMEVPIQVQEMLISEMGESGAEWWDGNTRELCNYVTKRINDYEKGRVVSYLTSEENRGAVVEAVIGSLAKSVISKVKKGYRYGDEIDVQIEVSNDSYDNVLMFAKLFGLEDEFTRLDLKRVSADDITTEKASDDYTGDYWDGENSGPSFEEILKARLSTFGVCMDADGSYGRSTGLQVEGGRSAAIYVKWFGYDDEESIKDAKMNGLLVSKIKELSSDKGLPVVVMKQNKDGTYSRYWMDGVHVPQTAYNSILSFYVKAKTMLG